MGDPGTAEPGAPACRESIVQQAVAQLMEVGDGPRLIISLYLNSTVCAAVYSKAALSSNNHSILPGTRPSPLPCLPDGIYNR